MNKYTKEIEGVERSPDKQGSIMNYLPEKEELIKIRNKLSVIFQSTNPKQFNSKKVHHLVLAMGQIDTAILNLTKYEK